MFTPATVSSPVDLVLAIAPRPLTIAPTASVKAAITLMAAGRDRANLTDDLAAERQFPRSPVSPDCVLVVEGDRLVGLITEHDLIQLSVTDPNWMERAIATVMTPPMVALRLTEFTDLGVPLALFQHYPIRQLPVVDAQHRVVALLTADLLWQVQAQAQTLTLQAQVTRGCLVTQIATQIRASLNLTEVLNTTVTTVRNFLHCDRLLVYQFQPDWNGQVVAESVGAEWPSCLGDAIDDPCFQQQGAALFRDGKTITIDNIHTAGYSDCYLDLLAPYQVKANLVVPILVAGDLWGLLIGHQCADYRSWQTTDLTLLDEIAVQLAIAIQQATTHQQLQAELVARQQAEAALQQSEAELRSLFRAMDDVVLVFDRQGTYLKILSPHSSGLYYPSEELLGRSPFDFFPSEPATIFLTCIEQTLATGTIQDCEYCLHFDQTERWFSAKCSPLTADTVLWVAREISDRKRAELEIQQQRALLRTVIDTTPNQIFVKDRNGRYLLANRAIANFYHTTVEELVGRLDRDFHQDAIAADRFLQENQAIIDCQESLLIPEEKGLSINGREQWYQWYKHPVTLPGTNTPAVLGVGVNITSHKEAQASLHQYERVVSATNDGIALLDRQYVYQLVNHVYLDWYGKSQETIVGHSVAELLGETAFQTLMKPYLDRCLTGVVQQYEAWFDAPQGAQRFVRITYAPYFELDGTINGVVVTTHDLTALKQAEAALQESEQFLRSIYDHVEQAIFTIDVSEAEDFHFVDFNPAAERLTGQSIQQMRGKPAGAKVRPHYEHCVQTGEPITYEECLIFQEAKTWWLTTLNPIRNAESRIVRIVGTSTEITQRHQAETLLKLQNTILERIAKTEPLADILDTLIRAMEWQLVDGLGSVMLCDRAGKSLHCGPAPHLSPDYMQAIEGVAIAEGQGSCGTAAFRRQPVIVTEIATDPLWREYQSLAAEYGLAACWSVPILASDGRILGTFALYYQQPRTPAPADLERITWAANLAGIAIERGQAAQALAQLNQELEQKVADRTAALQEREAQLRDFFDNANDLIQSVVLEDGRFEYVNRAWRETLGYSEADVEALTIFEVLHPDCQAHCHTTVAQMQAGTLAMLEQVELVFLTKNQAEIVVEGSINCRYVGDRPVASRAIFRDITERKRVESELRLSETKLEAILNFSPSVIYVKDLEGRHTRVNQAFLDFFGCTVADIVGKTNHEFFPADIADRLQANDQALVASGDVYQAEEMICLDGTEHIFLSNKFLLRDAADQPYAICGMSTEITNRKQAEAQLQNLSTRLTLALQAGAIGTWDWDFIHEAIWDEQMYAMYGLQDLGRPAVYRDWCDRLHPEDRDAVEALLQAAIQGHQEFDTEFRIWRTDGALRWVRATALVLRDEQGQPIRMTGINQDITDRKQSEAALFHSEIRFRRVFESSVVGMLFADFHGNILDANARFLQIVGYTRADLDAGRIHWNDITPPEYVAQDEIMIETLSREGAITTREKEYYRKDGSRVPILIGAAVLPGTADQAVCVVVDISDRKRLEQAQQRLITILEASTDYMGMSDLAGRVIWNNAAIKRLCGITSDAALAQRTPADYHPPWAMAILEQQGIPTAIATGSWLGDSALIDANGQEIPVSELLLAHKSPQGEVEFFSAIMRDMRVHKEYERRLERTNAELLRATQLKDEFLANMSHELRTPLNAILGMSETLLEEVLGDLNERQKNAIATVEQSGNHLLGLINDILELSKIEAGKLELEFSTVAIAQLCQSSINFVKQQALKKQIQLKLVLPPKPGTITLDERRIRQVLINLLTNAVKFTPIGGQVVLEAHPEPLDVNLAERVPLSLPSGREPRSPFESTCLENACYLCISVIDTGIGIAPADQVRLFQPFVQIDSRLNRQYEGTGLGLALVKRIVDLHGGDVSLSSELGEGSCFTVRLPYACKQAQRPPTPFAPTVASPQVPSIPTQMESTPLENGQFPLLLLAEDNDANIATITSYLEAKGYRILVAKNGAEAIALTRSHQPDLILMDIQMPEMDGLQAIQAIRQDPQLDSIPIIALTALAMKGDREKCLAAGATDYLSKPVKLKELAATIQQLLASERSLE